MEARMHQRSYANVGQLSPREDCGLEDGQVRPAPKPGDMTEAYQDAAEVLSNWVEVACFNIGAAQALRILVNAADALNARPSR